MFRRLGILLILLIAAALLYTRFFSSSENGVAVEIQEAVSREFFQSYVTASGEIVAARYADIGTDVMGKIVYLPVSEGQVVQAGALLARIDPVQASAEREAADRAVEVLQAERATAVKETVLRRAEIEPLRVAVEEARVQLERARALLEKGVISKAECDSAGFRFDSARASLEAARLAAEAAEQNEAAVEGRIQEARARLRAAEDIFRKTEIRSPIEGMVSRLRVRQGEMVVIGIQNQPGTTLMTVADLSVINAEVKVAEADILRLSLSQQARISLDAVAGAQFKGHLIEIGTGALEASGSGAAAREFKVVVRLDEPSPGLRPGMTCDAEILVNELENVVTVPLQAVVIRDREGTETSGVYVPRDGQAVFQPVQAGVIGGLNIVVAGISAGTPVVTGPYQILQELEEGTPIRTAQP